MSQFTDKAGISQSSSQTHANLKQEIEMLFNPYLLWSYQLEFMKQMTIIGVNTLVPAYATLHTIGKTAEMVVTR